MEKEKTPQLDSATLFILHFTFFQRKKESDSEVEYPDYFGTLFLFL